MKLLIVVPCYNEALSISDTVLQISSHGYDYCVVDDGSTDETVSILTELDANFIRHEVNRGQGVALRTGFEIAKSKDYEVIIHFDGDGQHNVNDIKKIVDHLKGTNADIVLGSRFLGAKGNSIPRVKRVLLQLARYFEFLRTGILLSDAHCGLRALRISTCRNMNLKANRMAHASEILSEVKRLKLRYSEVAVNINYDIPKKQESSLKRIFSVMRELIFLSNSK